MAVSSNGSDQGSPISHGFLYGFTIALFAYGWLSVNMYLPVLPRLESVFQTSPKTAKLTVTIFLAGFAVTQLIWGPLSDRFGRKPVLLTGVAISIIGAALSGLAPSLELFVAARLIESVGLGVGPVVGRSVMTDSLDRSEIAATMAYVVIVTATAPAVAPILGGYMALWLSWRSIFFFLALYGIGLWLLTRHALPETIESRTPSFDIKAMRGYVYMLGNVRYASYILIYGIAFGSMTGYYATTPYLFTRELGYAPSEYGYLLLVHVACYILGAETSRFLVTKLGTVRPMLFAVIAYAAAALMFGVAEMLGSMDTLSILLPMSVFVFGAGLVSPAANAGAMTLFHEHAGAASAFIGFAITIGGALFSGALAHLHIQHLWQLGAYVGVITLISGAVYLMLQRAPPAQS